MLQSVSYTEQQLCHYSYDLARSWFVYFDITNSLTGGIKRKQFRGGINYGPDKVNGFRIGNALIKYWKDKLADGWHPFEKMEQALVQPNTPFDEALNFALNNCIVSSATKKGYKGTVKFVKDAAKF